MWLWQRQGRDMGSMRLTLVLPAADHTTADCDGDGTLTFFDFLCFQNAFAAGRP